MLSLFLLVAPALAEHATSASPSLVKQKPVVRIGTGDWLPYVDAGRADAGVMGRLVTAIFAEAGYRVKFFFYPWTRNTFLLQEGSLDAVMPYYCSAERRQFAHCSEPVLTGELVLFHRRDLAFDWASIKDLQAFSIGATLGYFYGDAFEQAEKSGDLPVQRIARDEINLRLLELGRIQLYPQDRAVGYAMLRSQFPPAVRAGITHHPRPLHTQSVHLLFRRQDRKGEALLDIFNAGLRHKAASGELQRLQDSLNAGAPFLDTD